MVAKLVCIELVQEHLALSESLGCTWETVFDLSVWYGSGLIEFIVIDGHCIGIIMKSSSCREILCIWVMGRETRISGSGSTQKTKFFFLKTDKIIYPGIASRSWLAHWGDPRLNLGQTTTLGDSEREGRIGLDCLSINPKRAWMGSLWVLDCTLYILLYTRAARGYL